MDLVPACEQYLTRLRSLVETLRTRIEGNGHGTPWTSPHDE